MFLETLYAEVATAFPDAVFNIGGDEVSPHCYEENPEVSKYLTTLSLGTTLSPLTRICSRTLMGGCVVPP